MRLVYNHKLLSRFKPKTKSIKSKHEIFEATAEQHGNTIIDQKQIDLILNRISYLEKTNSIVRLRGGMYNNKATQSVMVVQAIESAKKHDINLTQGILNKADGNCAFESVINNINYRHCFEHKLQHSVQTYRQRWMTNLENKSSEYPTLGAGFTDQEQQENWNRLKQSGVYEIEFFGDMVMHGISMGSHKNILIFNTNTAANYPIYVIEAKQFGGYTDTDIPVVLAYNQVHYESLHPVSDDNIEKTKALVNSFISGDYKLLGKDIPRLISPSSSSIYQPKGNINIKVSNANIKPNIKEILKSKNLNRGKLGINGTRCKTIEDMKKAEKREYFQEIKQQRSLKQRKVTVGPVKRFKDMNPEEKQRYFTQKQREKRSKEKFNNPEGFKRKLRDEKERQNTEKKS